MNDAKETTQETRDAAHWLKELKASEKRDSKWVERAEKVVERYRDEGEDRQHRQKKMNLLWSNVETKAPLLYARTPKPVIDRRFKDKNLPAMVAGKILERAVSFCIDSYDFDGLSRDVVQDYLLPGRGLARVVYKPTYGKELKDPQTNESRLDEDGQPMKEVVYEEAKLQYLFWKDVRFGPGRRYEEVPWIAYRGFMSREELVREFGEIGNEVPLNFHDPERNADELTEADKKSEVWEVWSKTDRTVYFVAIGFNKLLKKSKPPLDLRNFFPSPKPLQAVRTNDKMTPIPEFAQYQDQADEIDKITNRIDTLTDALKVVGVYDSSNSGLERIFTEGFENKLVPVENFAMLAERGGLENAISWFPVGQVITVLKELYTAREQLKQNLYEVSGLSDILRGASNPNETLGAQEIKRQFAGMRMEDQQKAVAEFLRDCIEIKAEVIAEQFSPQTLQLMTGVQLPTVEQKQAEQTNLPTWEEVIQLLRTDPIRTFSVDIETDSTIAVDEVEEKRSRSEFLTSVTGFMKQTAEIAPSAPQLVPLMGELLMFGVRGFRVGRDLEQSIEDALEQAKQAASQPKPDPAADAAQQELKLQEKKLLAEHSLKQKDMEFEHRLDQQRMEFEMALERDRAQRQSELELFKAQLKHDINRQLALRAPQPVQN